MKVYNGRASEVDGGCDNIPRINAYLPLPAMESLGSRNSRYAVKAVLLGRACESDFTYP